MQRHRAVSLVLLASLIANAGTNKPKIKTARDHFPTGQDTPEGVAADFARVFVQNDAATLRHIALHPYGDGPSRREYARYLSGLYEALDHNKTSRNRDPKNPSEILRVFAARHLTQPGSDSYGYASFGFKEIMFVDVEVSLNDGSRHTDRTMVVEEADGKWYVDVAPYVSPIFSDALEKEGPSQRTFEQAYDARQ